VIARFVLLEKFCELTALRTSTATGATRAFQTKRYISLD